MHVTIPALGNMEGLFPFGNNPNPFRLFRRSDRMHPICDVFFLVPCDVAVGGLSLNGAVGLSIDAQVKRGIDCQGGLKSD